MGVLKLGLVEVVGTPIGGVQGALPRHDHLRLRRQVTRHPGQEDLSRPRALHADRPARAHAILQRPTGTSEQS
jgi:hypothetical protein